MLYHLAPIKEGTMAEVAAPSSIKIYNDGRYSTKNTECAICEEGGESLKFSTATRDESHHIYIYEVTDNSFLCITCHPNTPIHKKCLAAWINKNRSCPFDRREVIPQMPDVKLFSTNRLLYELDEDVTQVALREFSKIKALFKRLA